MWQHEHCSVALCFHQSNTFTFDVIQNVFLCSIHQDWHGIVKQKVNTVIPQTLLWISLFVLADLVDLGDPDVVQLVTTGIVHAHN